MAKSTPIQFKVVDMDCESCVASIESAVHGIDADAHVAADLATKHVVIGTDSARVDELIEAVEKAGFTIRAA